MVDGTDAAICTELKDILSLNTTITEIYGFKSLFEIPEKAMLFFDKNERIKFIVTRVRQGDISTAKYLLKRILNVITVNDEKVLDGIEDLKNNLIEALSFYGEAPNEEAILSDNEECIDAFFLPIDQKKDTVDNQLIIEKIKSYIENNFNRELTRDDIASHVYLSSWYAGKFFKQKTGISLNEYHIKIRMKKAVEYLRSNKKVAQIGSILGYTNQRQFLRNFKEYTGYTPTDYRIHILASEDK